MSMNGTYGESRAAEPEGKMSIQQAVS